MLSQRVQKIPPWAQSSPQIKGSFPGTGRALPSCPLGWGGLILCRGQESWQRHLTPRCLSSRNAHLHQQPEDEDSTEEGGLQEQVPLGPSSPWLPSCREARTEKGGDKDKGRGGEPKTALLVPLLASAIRHSTPQMILG